MGITDGSGLPWFELALELADCDVDLATGTLAELGFPGSEIVNLGHGRSELRVFLQVADEKTAAARASEVTGSLPDIAVRRTLRTLDENVWRDDWKRHFTRMCIGEGFEIFPPWDTVGARSSARLAIVINPGMAFGTGRHETTAACLELLEASVRRGDVVLDLGCGSGILAIAAAKLGADRVLAIDNDPVAMDATTENAASNQVQTRVEVLLHEGPPPASDVAFDLAVANILAEPLAAMAAPLTSCVKGTGTLVLSGIESQRRALVEVAYGHQGWRVTRAIDRSGWVSLALERR